MTKCYHTNLKTFVCGFMTLHLWVQTKHAKIYDFCFSLYHIVMESPYFKWNQTELPVVQNSWNFTSLSISLHFSIKEWLDVVRQNLKIGLKLLEGLWGSGGCNAPNDTLRCGHSPWPTIEKKYQLTSSIC